MTIVPKERPGLTPGTAGPYERMLWMMLCPGCYFDDDPPESTLAQFREVKP